MSYACVDCGGETDSSEWPVFPTIHRPEIAAHNSLVVSQTVGESANEAQTVVFQVDDFQPPIASTPISIEYSCPAKRPHVNRY